MTADFRTLFEAQLVALLVPDSAAPAAKVDVHLSIDGYLEYEGEPDQTTTTSLDVSITGYDEFGKALWNFSREYEGSRAPMTLLDAMERVISPPVSNHATDSKGQGISQVAPSYKTEASASGHEYRGGFPGDQ